MQLAEFVRPEKSIRKLSLYQSFHYQANYLDTLVIPLLSRGGFDNLTSVHLHWGAELRFR